MDVISSPHGPFHAFEKKDPDLTVTKQMMELSSQSDTLST